jgi:AbrB family looped-hinge helix DNA binding protein
MSYLSSVDSRGRVSIPQEIRNLLGLAAGDSVEFVVKDVQTDVRLLCSETNRFAKYTGVLKCFRNRKEINNWIKELRVEEQR